MGFAHFFLRFKMLNRGLDKLELLRIVELRSDGEVNRQRNSYWVNGKRYPKSCFNKIW